MTSILSNRPLASTQGALAATKGAADLFLSLPHELYQLSTARAVKPLLSTLALAFLSYFVATRLPWYYLPFVWIILGGLYSGLCAVALDCANNTFSRSKFVNNLVGNVVSIPLLVPFNAWRVHLKQRNFEDMLHSLALGRSWWLASISEWLHSNFDIGTIWQVGNRRLILGSMIAVWASAVVFFPLFVYTFGVWGLVKFWLMPWIFYHFWKSAFLQAAYRVPFTDQEVTIRIAFPVKYPGWVKLLSNDFAFLLSASRLFSHYIQEKSSQYIPNCNVQTAFAIMGVRNGVILDVEDAIEEEREKLALIEEEKELARMKKDLDFGLPVDQVPAMTWEQFKAVGKELRLQVSLTRLAKKYVVCDGLVFDVADFISMHPGGAAILERFLGHDITSAFNGAVYNHNAAARHLAQRFLRYRIDPPRPY